MKSIIDEIASFICVEISTEECKLKDYKEVSSKVKNGVYIIYTDKKVIYVGIGSVKKRLGRALEKISGDFIRARDTESFKYIREVEKIDVEDCKVLYFDAFSKVNTIAFEGVLIKKLNPLGNSETTVEKILKPKQNKMAGCKLHIEVETDFYPEYEEMSYHLGLDGDDNYETIEIILDSDQNQTRENDFFKILLSTGISFKKKLTLSFSEPEEDWQKELMDKNDGVNFEANSDKILLIQDTGWVSFKAIDENASEMDILSAPTFDWNIEYDDESASELISRITGLLDVIGAKYKLV